MVTESCNVAFVAGCSLQLESKWWAGCSLNRKPKKISSLSPGQGNLAHEDVSTITIITILRTTFLVISAVVAANTV